MTAGVNTFVCVRRHEVRRSSILLFLIGLFSLTQVRMGFSIGISEIFVYIAAPFLYLKYYRQMQKHGMTFLINLGILESVMCVISGLYNHTYPYFILRGLATTYPLFAFPVVLYLLLWKNMKGLRWLLLGVAISNVINIFAFQTSVELTMYSGGESGAEAVDAIMSGPIFWIGRLTRFVMLPIFGWYLQTPLLYSILAPCGMAGFALLTSVSGRSSALGALGGAFIAVICGKTYHRMKTFSRLFYVIVLLSIGGVFVANTIYHVAAKNRWLGDKAIEKFEKQTQGSDSILRLLMGGRGEVFIGLMAALEKPIIGFGPWAADQGEHTRNFLMKYGTEEDVAKISANLEYMRRMNLDGFYQFIPAHSHFVGFFLWFGILGLFYWIYVLYAVFRYLRKELTAVPQWVGFLAVGAPPMLWAFFFSGFGFRIYTMPYVVVLIMAHNVYKGRIPLTVPVWNEIVSVKHR